MSESQKKSLDLIFKTKGRGAVSNDSGRFNKTQRVYDITDADYYVDEEDIPSLKTEYLIDNTKTIINKFDSEDLGMGLSVNPYRGCEHGCIYCYARPTHEYFNLSAGLDFESKIFVKEKAPELLREELMKPKYQPEAIMMSGITDCYQPIERKLQITRRCLEVLAEFKNPVIMITKNFLITRDVDILSEMAKDNLVSVTLSVTSLDENLARTMEPRTSSPQRRLEAIKILSEAGVPVSVNIAPVIPGLTDHEIPRILEAAAHAGARSANYVMGRLPHSVKDLFVEWLDKNYPEKKDRVISAIRDVRGGKLYDSNFGSRMRGTGAKADHVAEMFHIFRRKYFMDKKSSLILRTDLFKRPKVKGDQFSFEFE
ncbi:PA0069 family radical SAM protein [Pseudobdellovibrio sp. HCB154]|uniref:PA0069 family radical SAM protein n=1 Tax=Pseudobdellovibrio sp. HCB154 TaxID=3386277 RepID=UPI0039171AC4